MGDHSLLSPMEEEDLEALRLAALQTMKSKQPQSTPFNGNQGGKFRRKFSKNGSFNNGWTRNANLISVPMVNEDSPKVVESIVENEPPRLILPQDRYCKRNNSSNGEGAQGAATSKFDRYNNSDDSESDTEDEISLKRTTSLEDLMAELENEIQGGAEGEKSVTKPANLVESTNETSAVKENVKPEKPIESTPPKPVQQTQRKLMSRRKWPGKPVGNNYKIYDQPPPSMQPIPMVFSTAPPPLVPQTAPQFQQFYPSRPAVYENMLPPLAPLSISSDVYTSTMAPLSPRSAAFVLENRAIIERRKRRSYSKSPSPSPPPKYRKRSRSRSPTPVRRAISRSLTPPPLRKTTNSPKRTASVRQRLGTKPTESKVESKKESETITHPDPVLEARRRKFERNEIRVKEGIIRLKAKTPEPSAESEKEETNEDKMEEDTLLDQEIEADELILDHTSLFSDEESNSDNEGRFKVKMDEIRTVKKAIGKTPKAKVEAKSEKKIVKEKISRKRIVNRRSPIKKVAKKDVVDINATKKIEIKIRNPGKYERLVGEKTKTERKVHVAKVKDCETNEKPQELKKSEDESNSNEGDLRAQLSRKRAERQKHPIPEIVPTRLLKTALQDAGFGKKTSKKSADKNENNDCKDKEERLPIHMRLGVEPYVAKRSKKKGGAGMKSKKTDSKLEQV